MTLAKPADSGPHKRPKDGRFGSGEGCETAASGLPCGPPSAFGEEERLPEGRRNTLTMCSTLPEDASEGGAERQKFGRSKQSTPTSVHYRSIVRDLDWVLRDKFQ